MPLSAWQPGTLYLPGQLVAPTSVGGAIATSIYNADFEAGDLGWNKDPGWSIATDSPYAGTYSAKYVGPGVGELDHAQARPVTPGTSITASCFVQHGASADNQAAAAIYLRWLDAGLAVISTDSGNTVSTGALGIWRRSQVTAVAPPGAAFVKVGCTGTNNWSPLWVDNFQWNYVAGSAQSSLAFQAIQAESGLSGYTEPVWPTTIGNTVVDNEVTWQAVAIGSITWEASSVLTSGSSEPTWPEEAGAFVSDNNISWEAVPLRITDENCPHSKVVAIAASKVFAGDTDIVRFCATLNARDWSSEGDAGYLPTGLQQKSQVGVSAMGVFRGNLAVWSPSTFQVWQVDPDPAAMALVDAMEGIGSTYQQAVQPVADDLFFLAALGVRSVSLAEGNNNLASGDVGLAIDTLVQAEVTPGNEPIATYYPSAGQYWLAFRPATIASLLLAGQWILTTTLYPVEGIDELDWTGEVVSCVSRPANIDELSFEAGLVSGNLGTLSIVTTEDLGELSWSCEIAEGVYLNPVSELDFGPDSVAFQFELTSGNLAGYGLVYHENPPDALDWSGEVLSVTYS